MKSKFIGYFLALILGGFGAHAFYYKKYKRGILYLVFSWTFIPFILGWIDMFFIHRWHNEFYGNISKSDSKTVNKTFSNKMVANGTIGIKCANSDLEKNMKKLIYDEKTIVLPKYFHIQTPERVAKNLENLKSCIHVGKPALQFRGGNDFAEDSIQNANVSFDKCDHVPLTVYYTTFDDLNENQKKWYFYWREQVLNGSYLDTDLSYVILFLYELINYTFNPNSAFNISMMVRLHEAYKDRHKKLGKYSSEWIADMLFEANEEVLALEWNNEEVEKPALYKGLQKHSESVEKIPINVWKSYIQIKNATEFLKNNKDKINKKFKNSIPILQNIYRKENTELINRWFRFEHRKKQRHLFRGAVCCREFRTVDVSYAVIIPNENLTDELTAIYRLSENVVRELSGDKRQIKVNEEILPPGFREMMIETKRIIAVQNPNENGKGELIPSPPKRQEHGVSEIIELLNDENLTEESELQEHKHDSYIVLCRCLNEIKERKVEIEKKGLGEQGQKSDVILLNVKEKITEEIYDRLETQIDEGVAIIDPVEEAQPDFKIIDTEVREEPDFAIIDTVAIKETESNYKAEKIFHHNRKEILADPYETFKKMRRVGFSYSRSEEKFCKQAEFMKDFTDDYGFYVDLFSYWTTYTSMNDDQLRTYFSWRARVRQGDVSKVSTSYAFCYIYELINNIGVKNPSEVMEKLISFWNDFRVHDEKIDKYMQRWVRDYFATHRNELDSPFSYYHSKFPFDHQKLDDESLDTPWESLERIERSSLYKMTKGSFYKKGDSKKLAKCVCTTFKELSVEFDKIDVAFEKLFYNIETNRYSLFSSAVYSRKNAISVPEGIVSFNRFESIQISNDQCLLNEVSFDKHAPVIGYILKLTELELRQCLGNSYIKHPSESKGLDLRCIQTALMRTRTQFNAESDSDEVFEIEQWKVALLEFIKGSKIDVIIRENVHRFCVENNMLDDKSKKLSDTVKVKDESTPVEIDMSKLERIRKDHAEVADKLNVEEFEISEDTSNNDVLINEPKDSETENLSNESKLTEIEIKLIKCLLESDLGSLPIIANESGSELEILFEVINEKYLEIVGDTIIDFTSEIPFIYEDYVDTILDDIKGD